MANMCDGVSQQTAEVNALNSKFSLDEQYDNRRETLARQRAYEDLNLRRAQNAATFDHFVNMTTAQSTSSAEQAGQDTTETAAGAETTANSQVAANVADLATALVPVISSAIATAVSEAMTAILPTLVAAAGNAAAPKA